MPKAERGLSRKPERGLARRSWYVQGCGLDDAVEHFWQIRRYLFIAKTEDGVPIFIQPFRPQTIILRLFDIAMDSAVDLNDKLTRRTAEVKHKRPERMLTTEEQPM